MERDKREQVIKALEEVIAEAVYPDRPRKFMMPLELAEDALALLKAQEAVEPVPGLWDRDIPLFNCGACGGEIGAGGIAKYCFHCGRAVKWE